MIAKMKKLTVLCVAGAREETLAALQEMGVLHLQHLRMPSGELLDEARLRLQHVRRALEVLPKESKGAPSGRHPEEIIEGIWAVLYRRKADEDRREELIREQARLRPFGNFEPAIIQQLRARGIYVRLFYAQKKRVPALPDDAVRVTLSEDKNTIYFALIARRELSVNATEVRLPEKSLAEIEKELAEVEARLARAEKELATFAPDRLVVAQAVARAEETVEFLEAREGMVAGQPVAWLQGFCPASRIEEIRRAARQHGWGLVVRDPDPTDKVPTLLEVVWWARPIQFLYDTLGILPGYDEVDISPVFLIFFSIFFGMLVGDAGYGILFLVATLVLRKKMPKALFGLLTITSLATTVWGALTGAWFSIASLPAPLAALRIEWLTDNTNIMELCFLIGAIHITVAHAWRTWLLRKRWQALSHLGWIALTWAMFFLARFLILQRPLAPFVHVLLGFGVVAVALFMTPISRLKEEWFGHAMLPLNIIGNFGDVVSYVRLFAVGAATLAVGQAFNQMLGAIMTNVIAGLFAAVVLFVMHALNIGMAILGVMVHGVRLNALEFSMHMDITWKGFPYRPFARHRLEQSPEVDATPVPMTQNNQRKEKAS